MNITLIDWLAYVYAYARTNFRLSDVRLWIANERLDQRWSQVSITRHYMPENHRKLEHAEDMSGNAYRSRDQVRLRRVGYRLLQSIGHAIDIYLPDLFPDCQFIMAVCHPGARPILAFESEQIDKCRVGEDGTDRMTVGFLSKIGRHRCIQRRLSAQGRLCFIDHSYVRWGTLC